MSDFMFCKTPLIEWLDLMAAPVDILLHRYPNPSLTLEESQAAQQLLICDFFPRPYGASNG